MGPRSRITGSSIWKTQADFRLSKSLLRQSQRNVSQAASLWKMKKVKIGRAQAPPDRKLLTYGPACECRSALDETYVRFGSKADMCSALTYVRFVPKPDIETPSIWSTYRVLHSQASRLIGILASSVPRLSFTRWETIDAPNVQPPVKRKRKADYRNERDDDWNNKKRNSIEQ